MPVRGGGGGDCWLCVYCVLWVVDGCLDDAIKLIFIHPMLPTNQQTHLLLLFGCPWD